MLEVLALKEPKFRNIGTLNLKLNTNAFAINM